MRNRTKPLMIAMALALGASAPAFGQSSGSGSDAGLNTNSMTTPSVAPAAPMNSTGPIVSPDSAPVVVAPAAATPMASDVDEEHGGLRNRLHGDDAIEHADAAAASGAAAYDDDARERAERNARATEEEEHGGLRNWWHEKKDRARAKLGMHPDDE